LSLQTRHHDLRTIKQFTRWLASNGRTRVDALTALSGLNIEIRFKNTRDLPSV